MRFSKNTIVKNLLEIYAEQKNKPIHRMNVIGRPYQRGNLEIKMNLDFSPQERVFVADILNKLQQKNFLIPTYSDLVAPTEFLIITEGGLKALATNEFNIYSDTNEVYLAGSQDSKQYLLLDKIGAGGFGEVYKAIDNIKHEEVAIKIFQTPINLTIKEAEEVWIREAKQSLQFNDPNIIKSYEFKKGNIFGTQKYYLVMELAREGNLNRVIKKNKVGSIFLADAELKEIFIPILKGLKKIHTIALHRDLKPENILIVNSVLKISDFGLAKYVEESTRTRTFKGAGTTSYMAPESWTREKMSKATDIYSLGIVFYQLVTNDLPYSSADDHEMEDLHRFGAIPSVRDKNTQVSNRIDGVIKKMMQKTPEDRFQNSEVIIEELERTSPNKKLSVGELVSTAKTILKKNEEETILKLKKIEVDKNAQKLIKFHFGEFIEQIKNVIENINEDLPEEKLWLSMGNPTNYTLLWGKRDIFRVQMDGEIYNSTIKIRGNKVIAFAKIEYSNLRQDEGINFILIKEDGKNYGRWLVLGVDISSLVPGIQYPRTVEFSVLERISRLGNAMDVITHTIRDDITQEITNMISNAFEAIKNPRKNSDMQSQPLSDILRK